MGNPHSRLPHQRSAEMSNLGNRPRNVVNHDVVSAAGTDLAAQGEKVTLFLMELRLLRAESWIELF